MLNAACTYHSGANTAVTTTGLHIRSPNATQDAPWIEFKTYTISSITSISGVCSTISGSAVALPTAYTIDVTETVKGVPKTLSGESLTDSATAAIKNHIGFNDCFVNAEIVTPTTPTKAAPKTRTSIKAKLTSGFASSTLPHGSASISPAAATTGSPNRELSNRADKIRIAVGVTGPFTGIILALLGGFLTLRRRKRARLAKISEQQQNSSDAESSSTTYRKPELDTEQRRHEMEAEKERCELEGQSSRLEMGGDESNRAHGGSGNLQELRGVEPSHELCIDHPEGGRAP